MKRVLSLLLAAMIGMSFAGCQADPASSEGGSVPEDSSSEAGVPMPTQTKIRVVFDGGWWEDPAKYDFVFEDFRAKYPQYELERVENMVESKDLLAAIQAGNQPDFWLGTDDKFANYTTVAYERMMMSLDDYLTRDLEVNFDTMDEKIMEMFRFVDGKYYGLPYKTSHIALLWNKDMFAKSNLPAKAPETWDEMLDYATRLIQLSDGKATQLGFSVQGTDGPYLYQVLGSKLKQQFKGDGITLDMLDPAVVETIEYCDKFYDLIDGKTSSDISYSFANGNCGMALGSLNQLSGYTQEGVDFGIAAVPHPDDVDKQVIPSYIWQFCGIPVDCQNPDGGWLFCKYVMTDVIYNLARQDMTSTPGVSLPEYAALEATRERIDTLFMSQANDETKAIYEERNKVFEESEFFYTGSSPLGDRLSTISNEWQTRRVEEGLTLNAYLEGLQNEYNGELATWKSGMEQQGWQFPSEDEPPIPPAE